MRFIHTADLHLAKPFGRFDEDTRAALRVARLDAVRKLGEAAVAHNAEFVLIAGDTFDAEAPPSKVVRRALDVMGEFSGLQWVLLPGNHDSLAAVDLWERIERDKPDNVILALTPDIIEIGDHIAILPAPPTVRNPGVDLTEWMTDAQTPVHPMKVPTSAALHSVQLGLEPVSQLMPLTPNSYIILSLGDFDGSFTNQKVDADVEQGLKRQIVGQFGFWPKIEHMVCPSDGLQEHRKRPASLL